MSRIQVGLQEEPLSLSRAAEFPPASHQGAQTVFSGVVRDLNHGKKVIAVGYDAFEPLAKRVLKELAEAVLERWGHGLDVLIRHRTGRLAVGEMSVLIVVNSPHRAEGYEASRWIIEEIKKQLPVWKQEYYEEGESEWLSGHALCGKLH